MTTCFAVAIKVESPSLALERQPQRPGARSLRPRHGRGGLCLGAGWRGGRQAPQDGVPAPPAPRPGRPGEEPGRPRGAGPAVTAGLGRGFSSPFSSFPMPRPAVARASSPARGRSWRLAPTRRAPWSGSGETKPGEDLRRLLGFRVTVCGRFADSSVFRGLLAACFPLSSPTNSPGAPESWGRTGTGRVSRPRRLVVPTGGRVRVE